jgi:hypothetical protein
MFSSLKKSGAKLIPSIRSGTLALIAGLSPDGISVTAEQTFLTIEGGGPEKSEREYYLHGISPESAAVQPG